MRRKRQSYLPGFDGLNTKEFGGSLLKGNPNKARPISTKRPLHLVMRSSLAKGDRSLMRHSRRIEKLVHRLGRQKGVRVYRYANAGNHLHLLLLPTSRRSFHAYVRALSGIVARIALKAERGSARGLKFWDARPFTRIVEWGREFKAVVRYVNLNLLEATGFLPLPVSGRAPP